MATAFCLKYIYYNILSSIRHFTNHTSYIKNFQTWQVIVIWMYKLFSYTIGTYVGKLLQVRRCLLSVVEFSTEKGKDLGMPIKWDQLTCENNFTAYACRYYCKVTFSISFLSGVLLLDVKLKIATLPLTSNQTSMLFQKKMNKIKTFIQNSMHPFIRVIQTCK